VERHHLCELEQQRAAGHEHAVWVVAEGRVEAAEGVERLDHPRIGRQRASDVARAGQDAETIAFGLASSIRVASSCAAKPPKSPQATSTSAANAAVSKSRKATPVSDTWVRIVAVGGGSGIGLLGQSVRNRGESA